ncbi:MAG: hypothetical protein ACT4PZ_13005 [Panacagrimonas sp.]
MFSVRVSCVAGLLLLVAPCQPGLAAPANIKLDAKVFQERKAVASDGKLRLERVPVARVEPGSEVIYEVSYAYSGKEEADVVITNPIPDGLTYRSFASRQVAAALKVSVDGGVSFGALESLKVPTGKRGSRAALATDITHVQWKLLRPVKPGEAGYVSLRAVVR